MGKKTDIAPILTRSEEEDKKMPVSTRPRKRKFISLLWPWLALVLVVGVVILIVVSSIAGYWLQNAHLPTATGIISPTAPPVAVTTLKVERTAPYAGLEMTVVNAQYATSFSDDTIQPGAAIVRLNMQVANHSNNRINVVYYTIAHLLAPGLDPLAATNTSLSTGPQPGASENGWIDFSVSKHIRLDTLTLQLGSVAQNESLVKMPFTGKFDPAQYADSVSAQSAVFDYTFSGNTLNYHLLSVETRFSYLGNQCKAGKRFYIINFNVDNQNGVDVEPGPAFDYLRMVINGYGNPPTDNTLPSTFQAGKSASGRVVFTAQAGLRNFSLGFLYQLASGEQDYGVNI
jgi:hypothetical protein